MMNDTVRTSACRNLRLPAEWEPTDAVIISWPHADTDWAYMLPEVTACYVDMARAIAPHARLIITGPDIDTPRQMLSDLPEDSVIYFTVDSNDTWMRDYGPITTEDTDTDTLLYNDFKFDGWGLKFAADKDNLFTSRLFASGLLRGSRCNRLSFVLEGGSIESDGRGTLLTTSRCLLSPNRNGAYTQSEIEDVLKEALGLKQVLWLDHGALAGDDTDSHIDTLARLAPNDTIIYIGCDDPSDPHFEELQAMEEQLKSMRTLPDDLHPEGKPFNLIRLPMPNAIYDEDEGIRLPATYANYLVVNDAVIYPTYGQQRNDTLAGQMLRIAFPDHTITGVDCRALIRQHGSLHCATMQLPAGALTI